MNQKYFTVQHCKDETISHAIHMDIIFILFSVKKQNNKTKDSFHIDGLSKTILQAITLLVHNLNDISEEVVYFAFRIMSRIITITIANYLISKIETNFVLFHVFTELKR